MADFNNIITYAKTCFNTFDELPFNELDAAIFSQLAYLFIKENNANTFLDDGMSVADLMRAEEFEEMCRALLTSENLVELIYAVVASPRFRNAKIKYYRNEMNEEITLQFAAVVFSFGENMHVVGYRGTDKSFIGWKEDVFLLMKKTGHGRIVATDYLNGVGDKLKGDIYVTGHSKGGNLAVFASAHCNEDIQDRIVHVYDLDGPGFLRKELEDPGMIKISDRVTKIHPVGSPVGVILKSEVEPDLVVARNIGILKHDIPNWQVEDNAFVRADEDVKSESILANNINEWAETVSDEEISLFAETLFGIIESTNMKSYDELMVNPVNTIKALSKGFKETPPEKRKAMFRVVIEAFTGTTKEEHKDIDWDKVKNVEDADDGAQFSRDYNLFL